MHGCHMRNNMRVLWFLGVGVACSQLYGAVVSVELSA